MRKSKQKSLHSKHGFTLVEVVVVMAILAICSTMLVGVISGSVDRYSKSSDIEGCKQEAVSFEEYYKRCVRGACGITEDTTYGTPTFRTQENYYYMIIKPATNSVTFAMTDGSGGLSNIITCNHIKSFTHKTDTVGQGDRRTYIDYNLSMLSSYEVGVTYDYPGKVIMNNGSGISIPSTTYSLETMTDEVCISFRMIP